MARKERASWGLARGDRITAELTMLELLGGGAAYEALLAFDEITFGPVVAKVLRPDLLEDPTSVKGLHREVAALAAVNHPVIVRALRHDLDSQRPHVVLEHVDGPRLSSLIRRDGALDLEQFLPLAIDLAACVHYLGHVGQVHLDIKPSNVIMGSRLRLIDLSLMRTNRVAARLAKPIGTRGYMSPEQCRPGTAGIPGPASDIWGLGATLFHAVTGFRPFRDGDPDADESAIRDVPDRVPAEVGKILYAMLEADPAARPTAREVIGAFESLREGAPPPQLPDRL